MKVPNKRYARIRTSQIRTSSSPISTHINNIDQPSTPTRRGKEVISRLTGTNLTEARYSGQWFLGVAVIVLVKSLRHHHHRHHHHHLDHHYPYQQQLLRGCGFRQQQQEVEPEEEEHLHGCLAEKKALLQESLKILLLLLLRVVTQCLQCRMGMKTMQTAIFCGGSRLLYHHQGVV
jgi:hypothetical protein